jgi:hypothetical protein
VVRIIASSIGTGWKIRERLSSLISHRGCRSDVGVRRSRLSCAGQATALVCAVVLVTGGCSGDANPAKRPAARFGVAAAIGPAPTVTLPARSKKVRLSIKPVAQPIKPDSDPLWGIDQQLGTAYQVAVSRETPGSMVHFRVDPAKASQLVKADGGSPSNLYVELYEPALHTWFPLASTYNAASHTVSAIAPHLSTISLGWVVEKLAETIFPGVGGIAVALTAKEFTKSFIAQFREAVSPPQQHDDCATLADKAWQVVPRIAHLSGCIASGSRALRMENHLLVPMDVGQPPGSAHASLLLQDLSHDSFPQFIERGLTWVADKTLLPAHGAAVVPTNAEDFNGAGVTVPTSADPLMIGVDVILGLLAVLPPDREWNTALQSAEGKAAQIVQSQQAAKPGSVSEETFVNTVVDEAKPLLPANVPGVLSLADFLNNSIKCLHDSIANVMQPTDSRAGLTSEVFGKIIKTGTSCFGIAVVKLGKDQFDENLKYAANAIMSIPDLIEKAREAVQWSALGPSSLFNQTYVLRSGNSVPVSASEFVTDTGDIECDNSEVQASKTFGAPITHSDPTEQSTTCFVKNYTGPTAHQPCVGLHEFTVRLDFGYYPTTFTCTGELPKELSPHPYQLHNGEGVDLGGATCWESDPAVSCMSDSFEGTSFTVSPTGITIPIIPSDTVEFAAAGFASNGAVRPSELAISADSSFFVTQVQYSSWTQQSATGTGLLNTNTCAPTCAAGKFTRIRIQFTLEIPILACGDFFFTRLSWQVITGDNKSHTMDFGPPIFDNATQETPCDALTP